MFKKSISTVLIGWIVIAVVAAVTCIILYVSQSSYKLSLKLEEQATSQLSRFVVKVLDNYLEGSRELAATLSVQQAVMEAADTGYTDRAEERLKDYMESYKDTYEAIFLFDTSGKVLSGFNSGGKNLAGLDLASRDYVREILNGKKSYISQKVFKSKDGQLIFGASHIVRNGEGKPVGGIGVFPKWAKFTETYIDPLRFADNGYGFMWDKTGIMIAHAMNKKLLLKNFNKFQFVKDGLKIEDGSMTYEWEGREKYMYIATVPQTGWKVCLSAYEDDIASTAITQRNILMGIGAFVVLVLVGIIVTLLRKLLLQPIVAIEAFTSKVAGGDYSAVLHNTFKYELSRLADNIGAMVAELKNKLGFAQGVLDGIPIPCLATDKEDKMVFVNDQMISFVGRNSKAEEYMDMGTSRFVFDKDVDSLSEQAINTQQTIDTEFEWENLAGRMQIAQITATPLYDLDKEMLGSILLCVDMTEQRNQQREIERKNEVIASAAQEADSISNDVASASEELSAQVEQSSMGAEEQRRRTSEVATAVEEMNATVLEVAKNASTSSELAQEARKKAQEGRNIVSTVVETSEELGCKAEELKNDMAELGSQADGIGNIMSVINDIADQTNLLALNAAIEAARAGDAGRGFAVVADEVRKLAEKTMQATSEVGDHIKSIQQSANKNIKTTEETTTAIRESSGLSQQAGEALGEIVNFIEQTADQVREIATASEEQSAASEQIARSAEEINATAGETAQAMNQSAEAVTSLARMASDLKQVINRMQE